MLAWMYLVPLAIFFFAKGRGYYMAAAYPMLMAMGANTGERWLDRWPRWAEGRWRPFVLRSCILRRLYLSRSFCRFASSGPLRDFALKRNGDLREEFGWNELVETVAGIRDSLPPDQQAGLGITVGNYGEQGAIEILGPAYHLPPPISTTNSAWLRGYPTPQPTTLIVLGIAARRPTRYSPAAGSPATTATQKALRTKRAEDHPDIFVCGPPRKPWAAVWKEHQDFG